MPEKEPKVRGGLQPDGSYILDDSELDEDRYAHLRERPDLKPPARNQPKDEGKSVDSAPAPQAPEEGDAATDS